MVVAWCPALVSQHPKGASVFTHVVNQTLIEDNLQHANPVVNEVYLANVMCVFAH